MRAWELGAASFWLIVGVAICGYAVHLRVWEPAGPGSGFMPFLAGSLMGLGGLALLVRTVGTRTGGPALWPHRMAALRVLAVILGLAAMTATMTSFGFVPTGVVLMIFLLRIIGARQWPWIVFTAVASTVAMYWIFDRVLDMSLPRGPLGF